MLAPTQFSRFMEVCKDIGNEVADENGFVAVRDLLARFRAGLRIRPLLVEGMLATLEDSHGSSFGSSRWVVLLDSETYAVSEMEINEETSERPLPSRLRNTIAHELVHSLAFRPSEFGIVFQGQANSEENLKKLVAYIEEETERLSPLLLCSDKALVKELSGKEKTLSVSQLQALCHRIGISRHVLINRFRLLRFTELSTFLHHGALRNIGIALGEWNEEGTAVIRSWPLFVNFDRNIVPAFLFKLLHQDRLPAHALFPDHRFAICGGSSSQIEFVTDAGSETVPKAEKMKIECSIGSATRSSGLQFFCLMRKLSEQETA